MKPIFILVASAFLLAGPAYGIEQSLCERFPINCRLHPEFFKPLTAEEAKKFNEELKKSMTKPAALDAVDRASAAVEAQKKAEFDAVLRARGRAVLADGIRR